MTQGTEVLTPQEVVDTSMELHELAVRYCGYTGLKSARCATTYSWTQWSMPIGDKLVTFKKLIDEYALLPPELNVDDARLQVRLQPDDQPKTSGFVLHRTPAETYAKDLFGHRDTVEESAAIILRLLGVDSLDGLMPALKELVDAGKLEHEAGRRLIITTIDIQDIFGKFNLTTSDLTKDGKTTREVLFKDKYRSFVSSILLDKDEQPVELVDTNLRVADQGDVLRDHPQQNTVMASILGASLAHLEKIETYGASQQWRVLPDWTPPLSAKLVHEYDGSVQGFTHTSEMHADILSSIQ